MTGFAVEKITVTVTSHAKGYSARSIEVNNGIKIKDLFVQLEGCAANPANFSITVNGRSNVPSGYQLSAGDRVSFSPVNVKGA